MSNNDIIPFCTRLYIVAPLYSDSNAGCGICNSTYPPNKALRTDRANLRRLF